MDQNRRLPTPLAMNAIPHGDQIMSNTESVPMGENPPKTKSFTFPSRTAARPQNSIKPAAQSKGGVRETPRVSAAEEENIELEKELTRVKQELMQLKENYIVFREGQLRLKTSYEAITSSLDHTLQELLESRRMSEGDTASMKPYPIEGSHLSKINQLKAIISELRDSRSSAYGVIDLLRDKLHHTSGQLAESIAKVKELKQGNERWDRLETKFEELTGQIREESVEALVGAEAKVATAVEVLRGTQMTLKKKEEELVDALDKNSRLQYQLGSTKQTALQLVEKNHGISKMLSEREEETIALKLELKLMKENAEKIQLSCGEDLQPPQWENSSASEVEALEAELAVVRKQKLMLEQALKIQTRRAISAGNNAVFARQHLAAAQSKIKAAEVAQSAHLENEITPTMGGIALGKETTEPGQGNPASDELRRHEMMIEDLQAKVGTLESALARSLGESSSPQAAVPLIGPTPAVPPPVTLGKRERVEYSRQPEMRPVNINHTNPPEDGGLPPNLRTRKSMNLFSQAELFAEPAQKAKRRK